MTDRVETRKGSVRVTDRVEIDMSENVGGGSGTMGSSVFYQSVDEPVVPSKRVRIAVLIDNDGRWLASGRSILNDKENCDEVECWWYDENSGSARLYWIEADVPVPVVQTVRGEVTE